VLASIGSTERGLTHDDAVERLARVGRNALPLPPSPTLFRIFLRQFRSPLIYVLLFAAVIAFALGHVADGTFVGIVLLLNAVVGAMQERAADRSAAALRELVATRSVVVRDGERHVVDTETIVPGDVVLLEAGTRVPADVRLLSATALSIDESQLTGESLPVAKDPAKILDEATALADRVNMAFAGSIVARGHARGVVVATGPRTELGALAASLRTETGARPPLLVRMEAFARRIVWIAAASAVLVAVVVAARGMPLADAFFLAVALGVSIVPEGLPVALTIALSVAARRMSRRHVIVRKLVAVEALGSCTFIATDKTGTLTVNELTVTSVALPGEEPWRVTAAGEERTARVEAPAGGGDDGDTRLRRLARAGVLASDAFFGEREGRWTHHGDAVDVAVVVFGNGLGLDPSVLDAAHEKLAEIPFDPEERFAASLRREGSRMVAHVKGAVERLLPMCSRMAARAGEVPIDAGALEAQAAALAASGKRVLAVASGEVALRPGESFGPERLRGLVFLGIVAMSDPLRPNAKEAIQACRRAGIEVAMVTGDHPATALATARELGLADSMDQVVTGARLDELSKEGGRWAPLLGRARVFARVAPNQKLAIVQALARAGHFVAVTGDGANDAPALRAAHVGIALGAGGTDVAREASELVVTNDDLASIVAGVEEGRIAYANVRKVVFFLVSTGAAEVVLYFAALAMALPAPLLPVQLLWLNLVTSGLQDVALAFEPKEGDELGRPPRPAGEPLFDRWMLERVVISALVTGGASALVFRSMLSGGASVEAARNAVLLLFVLFENLQIGAARSETLSIFRLGPLRNPLLLGSTIAALLVHVAAMHLAPLRAVLHTAPVPLADWPVLFALALLTPIALEVHKVGRRRRVGPPGAHAARGASRCAADARLQSSQRPTVVRSSIPTSRPSGAITGSCSTPR